MKTNTTHPLPTMCILFHPSCFSLLSACYKFLEYLNTVPCNKFVSSSFIAFILHNHFFLPQDSKPAFHFFSWLILFKRRKNGEVFVNTILFSPFFLLTWLKLITSRMLLQPKCIFIEKFSVPTSKRISLAIGKEWALHVSTGYKTGFKHCVFKGTF